MKKKKKIIILGTLILLGICLIVGLIILVANTNGSLTGTAGVQEKVELMNMYEDDSGNFIIATKRKTDSKTSSTTNFSAPSGNIGDLYPGSVVKTNTSKITASQKLVEGEDLPRKNLKLNVDIKHGTSSTVEVENPNKESVMRYIQKEVKNENGTAETSVKYALVSSEDQIQKELGIVGNNNNHWYNVDYKAIEVGKQKVMLVVFEQIYYSVKTDPQKADSLFADSVTKQTLTSKEIGPNNYDAAEVTSVNYGRRIVVKLTTQATEHPDAEKEWKEAISNTGIKKTSIDDDTSYRVYIVGGTKGSNELSDGNYSLSELNELISSELKYTKGMTAVPLSYTMNYLHDKSEVAVSVDGSNSNIVVENRNVFKVHYDPATKYVTKEAKLYGRPIVGLNGDGSYKLGNWEQLTDNKSKATFNVKGKYAELAFAFDISSGTDWPYNDIFWKADKPAPKDITIEWGGGTHSAWIEITVDGTKVVDESNCSKHSAPNYK